MIHSRPRGF